MRRRIDERGRGADKRLSVAMLALLGLLGLMGCDVDTRIPADALLSCYDDSHCPPRWKCDQAAALCITPENAVSVDPQLFAARSAFCSALWSAGRACEDEMYEALGENADVFSLPQPTFIHVCATKMLSETTTDDILELRTGTAILPLLPCPFLVNMLCDMIDDPDEAPGCQDRPRAGPVY